MRWSQKALRRPRKSSSKANPCLYVENNCLPLERSFRKLWKTDPYIKSKRRVAFHNLHSQLNNRMLKESGGKTIAPLSSKSICS